MSLVESPSNTLIDNVTNVVSPTIADDGDTNDCDTSVVSKSSAKIPLKNVLIHRDLHLHNKTGEMVLLVVLKIAKVKGFEKCFGYSKRGPFIKDINKQDKMSRKSSFPPSFRVPYV